MVYTPLQISLLQPFGQWPGLSSEPLHHLEPTPLPSPIKIPCTGWGGEGGLVHDCNKLRWASTFWCVYTCRVFLKDKFIYGPLNVHEPVGSGVRRSSCQAVSSCSTEQVLLGTASSDSQLCLPGVRQVRGIDLKPNS